MVAMVVDLVSMQPTDIDSNIDYTTIAETVAGSDPIWLYLTFACFILFRLFIEQKTILLHLFLYISHVLINLSIRSHMG